MYDRGWTPVNEINAGDWILTETGDWQKVQEVYATGDWETVYNLRVEDHHTYFVGDDDWGWSAWAHNVCKDFYIFKDYVANNYAVFHKKGNGSPYSDPVLGTITGTSESDVRSKLQVSPPIGAKVSVSTVIEDPFNAEWLKDTDTDFLTQNKDSNHLNWPTPAPGVHAHHIVMKKGSSAAVPFVEEMQEMLQRAGIEPIFGKSKLVWAPNWPKHRTGTVASDKVGNSGKGYAKAVLDILNETDKSKDAINAKLKTIAEQFIQGIW